MPKGEDGVCVVEQQLAAPSGRLRPELLKERDGGGRHFAAPRRLTRASPHTLTRSLRALEAAEWVARSRASRWGPCPYTLTDKGQQTVGALDVLADI